jgi:Transposase DDE domain
MGLSTFSRAISVYHAECQRLPHDFKRKRKFTLSSTMMALMQLSAVGNTSYVRVLNGMSQSLGWRKTPTPGALSQARDKVPTLTTQRLWEAVRQEVLPAVSDSTTQVSGLRLVAIDGTRVLVPDHPEAEARFGRPSYLEGAKKPLPQALLVMGFDVLSRVPVGASLMRYDGSERVGAMAMADLLGPGTLAVMDRGFVGKVLLRHMVEAGGDVLLRMTTSEANSWDCVFKFLKSRARETTVDLVLPARAGFDEQTRVVRVRLVRRVFSVGRPRKGQKRDTMVLMTTVTDPKRLSANQLVDLYAERWGIETLFRDLKTVFNLEQFHSRSPDRITQEIYAALIWLTLAAAMEYGAMALVRAQRGRQSPTDSRRWQIRRALLYHFVQDRAIDLMELRKPPEEVMAMAKENMEYLARFAAKRRPDRSTPRETRRPWGRFEAN